MSPSRAQRVTLSDIAAQLGISKASVSYALNGRPGVSDETRARVIELADRLGFHASSAAVALSASRTGTIGIVIARDPDIIASEGYYMRTLVGVEQYLHEHEAQLLVRLTSDQGEDLEVYRRWTRQGRVDGFLLFDEHEDDPRGPLLSALGMPAVLVTSLQRDDGLGRLVTPEPETTRVMMDHLHTLGHRDIGHISGPLAYAHERVRTRSLDDVGAALGMRVRHVEGAYDVASGSAAAAELVAPTHDRPTAVIAGNDLMATGALTTLTDLGLRVPTDLSLVSWEDSVLCDVSRPAMTAMDHGLVAKGREATDLLFELINGGETLTRPAPLGTLTVRGSTGPAPRGRGPSSQVAPPSAATSRAPARAARHP